MGIKQSDYEETTVRAAFSVLLEVHRTLGEYRDNIVLLGGWVPYILVSKKHIGSMDIDLALDHNKIDKKRYASMEKRLLDAGYKPGKEKNQFLRTVKISNREIEIKLDLLAGELGGTGKGRRHQKVQGLLARKAHGCDIAFILNEVISIEGTLPGGGEDRVEIRVASAVPLIVMKGMTLRDRLKEKDAYDIYFCIKEYPGGINALAQEFEPHLRNDLVREGLKIIAEKFKSIGHVGPKHVVDFLNPADDESREQIKQDAYQRVNALLEKIGIASG